MNSEIQQKQPTTGIPLSSLFIESCLNVTVRVSAVWRPRQQIQNIFEYEYIYKFLKPFITVYNFNLMPIQMWDSTIFARFKDLEGDQMTSDGTEGHMRP